MSNYIIVADIDNWPAGLPDAEKQARIDSAEDEIERITRDFFYKKDFDVKKSGNGASRLFLPFRQKALSVSSISINGEALPAGSWDFNGYSVFRTDDGVFDQGLDNIRIQGQLGWDPTPAAIKQAAKIMVRDMNDETLYKHFIKGSETQGDYRYDYSGPVYTGILEADKILDLFINRTGSFL